MADTRKIGLGQLLGWFFGGLLILGGVLGLVANPILGLFTILAGLMIFPPFWASVMSRWKIALSTPLKVFLLILFLVLAGGAQQSKGGGVGQTTSNTQFTLTATPSPTEIAALNQSVEEGDFVFTVQGVRQTKMLGNERLAFSQRTAQGIFQIVTLQIHNKGAKTHIFDSTMAKVLDGQGREYSHSVDGQRALGWQQGKVDLFLQQIQPNLSYVGDIVFDVPEDIQSPVLLVKSSWTSKGKKISLLQ